ncbi:hypothetical protein [Methanogenium organophilum]|uniref:Uncharacterized protein n=1 Tax=Methanogenium organophilum TaxID=2199 RepID=A0A9X9T6K5_METOG|nr:hypothetical protein [Methanogenium organophilum]WAI00144.1 hypothetical protein OU421_06790 [Methanogenium organophilum]
MKTIKPKAFFFARTYPQSGSDMMAFTPEGKGSEVTKPAIWVALVVIAVLMEFYCHLVMGISTIYTSFSYLVIAIGGLWYRKGVVYMGAALGFLHIIDEYVLYLQTGIFEPAVILQGVMYFVVAVIVWIISGMAEKEHFALVGYITETALRLKEPLNDISKNLEDIAGEVTDEEIHAQILVQAAHAARASGTIRELNHEILSDANEIPDVYRDFLSR